MKIYVARQTYRPRSHPLTWASRILANHCIDLIRHRRVRPTDSLDQMQEAHPGRDLLARPATENPETDQQRRDLRRRVEEAVATLPRTQREVFTLRHFEEMSLEEIATARGCALGTVKSSLHRAAAAVRDHLTREGRMAEEPGS